MSELRMDFTGRRVLVAGGARGSGLALAHAFWSAGADVTVTGTKILPSLYDADLSAFSYHQLQLSSSDAIDFLVDSVGPLDILVTAAGARLPSALSAHEAEFVSHSARLGFVGPLRLAHQLRQKLSASTLLGGGVVVHTSATLAWLELTQTPEVARQELLSHTERTGRAWARLGTRVVSVLGSVRPAIPVQQRSHLAPVGAGGTVLTRARSTRALTRSALAEPLLFLASSAASGISGQTLVVDAGL